MYIATVLTGITVVIVLVAYWLRGRKDPSKPRICVLVLGDIGRSPRMQYHALSCAKAGFRVDMVGFGGSNPIKELAESEKVVIKTLPEFPESLRGLPKLLFYALKAIIQFFQLFVTLLSCGSQCTHLLVQNPPAIPSLAAAWFVSLLCGSKFVIDWHNYGFTILALGVKNTEHPLVKVAKWYEFFFGGMSSINLCVTQAMQRDLWEKYEIRAHTLYDRPPLRFHEMDLSTQHQLFLKLSKEYEVFSAPESPSEFKNDVTSMTAFTIQLKDGRILFRQQRPALLVSSTSWTEDEDFSILLDSLEEYEKVISEDQASLPSIVCAITGKGPLKEYYQTIISKKNFKHVKICTPWLEPEDYPRLLGSADLGVCLHKSSSGLDLPMKVVDMFGCGLPVCAIHFECLHELVKHEENGLIFRDSMELTQQLKKLFRGFPLSKPLLTSFRENLASFQRTRWDASWKKIVLPLLKEK
nr:chitobiosyldiphosphodolichol beta-mannosyltransferase-like [Pocillopora verrucosa]